MTTPNRIPWTARREPEPEPPTPIEYLRSRGGVVAQAAEQAERELAQERGERQDPRAQLGWKPKTQRRDHRAAAAGNER